MAEINQSTESPQSTQRLVSESFLQYANRLINMRQGFDITNQEIIKLLFNQNISPDEARKRIRGIELLLTHSIDETECETEIEGAESCPPSTIEIEPDSTESQLELKIILRTEQVKLRDQRRLLNSKIDQLARYEHLQQIVCEAIENNMHMKPLLVNYTPPELSVNSLNQESILVLSDWHSDALVDNITNKYNFSIFKTRLSNIVDQAITHSKNHNIDKIHVFNLNDLISGIIHVSTRVEAGEDAITSLMRVCEILSELLVLLAKHIPNVVFYNCTDNHSRLIGNKKEAIPRENFARLIPFYLEARLINHPTIVFNEDFVDKDGDIILTKICGMNVSAVHGHDDRPASVVNNLKTILPLDKQDLDLVIMGHYHSYHELEVGNTEVVVNPSLIGGDGYSKSIRKNGKARQMLLILENGKRICNYFLYGDTHLKTI